ncbi:MAG: hypothetical protein EBX52_07150 [Proteobacteria bacterium]|nr:hypothetical protein [Pseudomonadota bacterium]
MRRAGKCFALMVSLLSSSSGADEFCGLKCDPAKSLIEPLSVPSVLGAPAQSIHCGIKANQTVLSETPLAGGGRRVMALAYGSCEVLKLKTRPNLSPSRITGTFKDIPNGTDNAYNGVLVPSGVDQVRKTHPYLEALRKAGCSNSQECSPGRIDLKVEGVDPACKKMVCDAYNSPAMYQYAGKARRGEAVFHQVYTRKTYSSKTKKTTTNQYSVAGVDCSYFVFEAMGRAGLNYAPNQPNSYRSTLSLGTLGARGSDGKRLDCFDRVNSAGGIRSGDLLVTPGVHVVMVDTVGADPFGIDEMIEGEEAWNWKVDTQQRSFTQIRAGSSTLSDSEKKNFLNALATQLCSDLDPARFKVTIIHSSSHGNGVGIQREEAYSKNNYSGGLGRNSPLLAVLKLKAKAECITLLKEKWKSFAPGFESTSNTDLEAIRKSEKSSGGTKVLRHASDEPGCRGEPPFDPAMNCADCCDLNSSYEGLTGGLDGN